MGTVIVDHDLPTRSINFGFGYDTNRRSETTVDSMAADGDGYNNKGATFFKDDRKEECIREGE